MIVDVGGGDEGVGLEDEVDWVGFAFGVRRWRSCRSSLEKTWPLTPMIFMPGASLALSAGPVPADVVDGAVGG